MDLTRALDFVVFVVVVAALTFVLVLVPALVVMLVRYAILRLLRGRRAMPWQSLAWLLSPFVMLAAASMLSASHVFDSLMRDHGLLVFVAQSSLYAAFDVAACAGIWTSLSCEEKASGRSGDEEEAPSSSVDS